MPFDWPVRSFVSSLVRSLSARSRGAAGRCRALGASGMSGSLPWGWPDINSRDKVIKHAIGITADDCLVGGG